MSLTRRTILKMTGSAMPALAAAKEQRFRKQLGVQLYTVREQLPKDPDTVLKRILDIGYSEVEAGRADLEKITPILTKYHMTCPSAHFETGILTGQRKAWSLPDDLTWDTAIETAKKYNLEFMVIPYIMPTERKPEVFRALVDKLNTAGEACHKAGLKLCYHNHAFEFGGEKGQRPIDLLLERTDKKLVGLEADVFWLATAGNDPVQFLNDHSDRVRLLHLKDRPSDARVAYNEMVPATAFREVGKGSLDFAAILRTGEKIGVRHYFVEQDQTQGDPVESLRTSYKDIRALTL